VIFAGWNRIKEDEVGKKSKTAMILRALVLIIGIISLIVFFLTEDLSHAITAFDSWSVLMIVLLVVALIIAFVSFRFDVKEKEEP